MRLTGLRITWMPAFSSAQSQLFITLALLPSRMLMKRLRKTPLPAEHNKTPCILQGACNCHMHGAGLVLYVAPAHAHQH